MSLIAIAILCLVVLGAAFVQGAVGIGFALIVAPVMGLIDASYLPGTLLLLMLPLNFHVAWRERASIDRRGAGWITLGRFFGTFLGMGVLIALSLRQLELAVGLFTVLAAVVALIAPPFAPNRGASLAVGLVTGVTETATGIGGPPLALLYQHARAPVLRATVATCFLVGEVISLVILAIAGKLHADQMLVALYLTPAVLIGSALSRLVHARINGPRLRLAVLVFAIVSGLFLMLRA